MLPALQLEWFHIGPLTISVWGTFALLGFAAAMTYLAVEARKDGDPIDHVFVLGGWTMIGALVGARIVEVLCYQPSYYSHHILEAFKIWDGGLASSGGIIGGATVAIAILKKWGVPLVPTADRIVPAVTLAMAIGRIGCYLTNDHPGLATGLWWGVRYPDGIIRHDLGLELVVANLMLFGVLLLMRRLSLRVGVLTIIAIEWKGMSRVLLDFLRLDDGPFGEVRYWGLTPAQIIWMILMAVGVVWLGYIVKKHRRLLS